MEGELEDWKNLKNAISNLDQYGLEWWTPTLFEIADKFIETYRGNVDKNFWNFIFKVYGSGSGVDPRVDGWVLNFIPYIDN